MSVDLNFNAANVQPSHAPEAVPAGWYNVMIVESELRPTKDKTSQYLRLEMQILDGQYQGQKIFDNLNLWHSNPVTCRIAQEQLSGYCHATGVLEVAQSSMLHNIPFECKVNREVDPEGKYEPSNNVKDRLPMGSGKTGGTATAPSQYAAPAPAAPQAPPAPAAPQAPPAPAAPQGGWQQPAQQPGGWDQQQPQSPQQQPTAPNGGMSPPSLNPPQPQQSDGSIPFPNQPAAQPQQQPQQQANPAAAPPPWATQQ